MGEETGFLEAGQERSSLDLNEKEPVRPTLAVEQKVADIGGLETDGKAKRESDEAVEAAYADDQPPFMKKMRLRYEEAAGSTPADEPAEDEEPGEAHKVRAVKDPGEPSAKDVEEHRLRNHVPFRIWCPYCLAAKAKERGHFSKGGAPEEEDNGIPRFGLD